jgi:tetraacyldisaccharide 4'-kinase
VSQWLTNAWHRGHAALWLLWPLSLLYALTITLRRAAYCHGVFSSRNFSVPIVVIGNITVGGTGKTPLTLALIERLQREGFHPGVVSRGYGGHADYPLRLDANTTALQAGDEPVSIYRRTAVPVVVDPRRGRAVEFLLQKTNCDVVLCDDGLQHYALARDIEIAVIDGARGVGNGWLLPAGPLREPRRRLSTVDYVVVNGAGFSWPDAYAMQLQPLPWKNIREASLTAPKRGDRIHAAAGIGNPPRFFAQLQAQGFDVIAHAFPDHHEYVAADLEFNDGLPVVMTEKDAVKCEKFAAENWWSLPVSAELPEDFYQKFLQQLNAIKVKQHVG